MCYIIFAYSRREEKGLLYFFILLSQESNLYIYKCYREIISKILNNQNHCIQNQIWIEKIVFLRKMLKASLHQFKTLNWPSITKCTYGRTYMVHRTHTWFREAIIQIEFIIWKTSKMHSLNYLQNQNNKYVEVWFFSNKSKFSSRIFLRFSYKNEKKN